MSANQSNQPKSNMKKIDAFLASSVTSFALFIIAVIIAPNLVGCKTVLDPAGVYQGDTFLYNVDKTISLNKLALTTFVKWEMDNRPTILAQYPAITVTADKVRAEAPKWFAVVGQARQSYIFVRDLYFGQATATATNTITAAQADLNLKVGEVTAQVVGAQVLINSTTIPNKPKL
jgi:hypothetical protein